MRSIISRLQETHIEQESNGVLIVTLNRPKRGNAFTARMADELDRIFHLADLDDTVKIVILCGSPDSKFFCAGADLQAAESGQDTTRDLGGIAALSIWHCRKPTIVAIHGAAVGIGITLTLPCDLRIVEEDTTVGFVFARRGLSVEGASSFFLPRLVGHGKASELCLRAHTFKAHLEPSLWTQIVPRGQALAKAKSIAAEMLTNSSLSSLVYIKRCLNAPSASTPQGAHQLESRVLEERFQSSAVAEGFASFLEKRPARFVDTAADVHPDLNTWSDWPTRYLPRSKL